MIEESQWRSIDPDVRAPELRPRDGVQAGFETIIYLTIQEVVIRESDNRPIRFFRTTSRAGLGWRQDRSSLDVSQYKARRAIGSCREVSIASPHRARQAVAAEGDPRLDSNRVARSRDLGSDPHFAIR